MQNPIEESDSISYREAIHLFASIIEQEFRSKLFLSFRDKIHNEKSLLVQAQKDSGNFERDSFYKFLIAPKPPKISFKQPKITLGAMLKAISQCTNSQVSTDLEFLRSFPLGAAKTVPKMDFDRIVELRNEEGHGRPIYVRGDVLEMEAACKSALDWLFSQHRESIC